VRLTIFHTEYRVPSGPGAKEGQDLLNPYLITPLVRGSAEGSYDRLPLAGRGSFGGKKWFRRALLMETASGKCRSGVQGGPERSWSTKGGCGPCGPPGPLRYILIHTF